MRCIKSIFKLLILFCIGGFIYYFIEIFYRNLSTWQMAILGGLCFVACGLINELYSWETPLWLQSLIATIIITLLEFISGLILNVWLGLHIWDYSNLPFNIFGQISLYFSLAWLLLSVIAIVLDDVLRWLLFHEDKPRYKLF
jgi:uncharacterized membrane protein